MDHDEQIRLFEERQTLVRLARTDGSLLERSHEAPIIPIFKDKISELQEPKLTDIKKAQIRKWRKEIGKNVSKDEVDKHLKEYRKVGASSLDDFIKSLLLGRNYVFWQENASIFRALCILAEERNLL